MGVKELWKNSPEYRAKVVRDLEKEYGRLDSRTFFEVTQQEHFKDVELRALNGGCIITKEV